MSHWYLGSIQQQSTRREHEYNSSSDESSENDEGCFVDFERADESGVQLALAAERNFNCDSTLPPVSVTTNNHNLPPTPWRSSQAKQRIINELKDESSDIHLFVGQYTPTDWKDVNFHKIREKYASTGYKMSNFRENIKRLLKHFYHKTGDFKEVQNVVEPWYTSVNKVSAGYKLLWLLHIDSRKNRKLDTMTVEQIWKSHPKFQQYDFESFKKWNSNMANRTSKRRKQIAAEEDAFRMDLITFPRQTKTARNIPFWYNHPASKLLEEDVRNGTSATMKPLQLWESRIEYQGFPLLIFRKHIYQERTKQLAAPCWQHTRNRLAQKQTAEEAEKMKTEWHRIQWDEDIE